MDFWLHSRYGDYDEDSGAGSRQPSASKGRLGAGGGRTRVQFARGSRLGLGQGGGSRRGATHRPAGDKQDPQDYMSKAKQLWNYVGKVLPVLIAFCIPISYYTHCLRGS